MKKRESALWNTVKKNLGPHLRMTRHECVLTAGTPDVSFWTDTINGWIELKSVRRPVRWDTAVLRGKISPAQIRFLMERPHTWLLVLCGDTLLAVPGKALGMDVETWPFDRLYGVAAFTVFSKRPMKEYRVASFTVVTKRPMKEHWATLAEVIKGVQ